MELETIRHSAAHLMAAAVKKLYPDIVLDVAMRYDENTVEDQEVDNNE